MTTPLDSGAATVLARRLAACGQCSVDIAQITALSGGASSETYQLDATRNGAAWPLILQRTAGDVPVDGALTKVQQAQLQMVAHAHGLPVAEVIYSLAPDDGLGDGYVMARLAGESLAPRYLSDPAFTPARALLGPQTAAALARIHSIDLATLAHVPLKAADPAAYLAQLYAGFQSFSHTSAAMELGFAWAARHTPAASRTTLVHGDFRSGNFLVDANTGLTGVLDWELAHIGDPCEDIGWICCNSWRFGKWRHAVGGFADRAEFCAAYVQISGYTPDPAALAFWEMVASLRWGLSCLQLVHQFLSGAVVSIERAAIGRRISEVELDVLYMLRHGTI